MKINENEFFPKLNSFKDIVTWSNNLVNTLSTIYRNIAREINNKSILEIYNDTNLPATGKPGQIIYNETTDEYLKWSVTTNAWTAL